MQGQEGQFPHGVLKYSQERGGEEGKDAFPYGRFSSGAHCTGTALSSDHPCNVDFFQSLEHFWSLLTSPMTNIDNENWNWAAGLTESYQQSYGPFLIYG